MSWMLFPSPRFHLEEMVLRPLAESVQWAAQMENSFLPHPVMNDVCWTDTLAAAQTTWPNVRENESLGRTEGKMTGAAPLLMATSSGPLHQTGENVKQQVHEQQVKQWAEKGYRVEDKYENQVTYRHNAIYCKIFWQRKMVLIRKINSTENFLSFEPPSWLQFS